MDIVIGKLKAKIQRYDEDIQKEVSNHIRDKEKVKTTVKQAHNSITVCISEEV